MEVGELRLVAPDERISGPGTSVVMAAFTHLNPEGSRFSDGTYGVFWDGREVGWIYEKRFLSSTRLGPGRRRGPPT